MCRRLWIIFALIASSAARPASAEINAGYSAEWLAHSSKIVALAVVLDAEVIKGPGEVSFVKARFKIEEPLKGGFTAGDTMTVYDWSFEPDPLKLVDAAQRKRHMLIFCSISEHNFREIDGKFIFTEQHSFKSAYYMDAPVHALYSADFRRVSRFENLLERTRAQVRRDNELQNSYWKGSVVKKELDVPPDTEAWDDLYSGSVCYVYVPDYQPR